MDRFPIMISIKQAVFNIHENWELNKANWTSFYSKYQCELTDFLLTSCEPMDSFTSALITVIFLILLCSA